MSDPADTRVYAASGEADFLHEDATGRRFRAVEDTAAERDRLLAVNAEALMVLEGLLADVLNLASGSVKNRPSVHQARAFIARAKESV